MQTGTTLRYHLTPVRMAIKKTRNIKCWRECGEKGVLNALLVGMQIGIAATQNSTEIPQKIKNRTTI